ncbi:proteasome subunit beta type [Mitosporidium daphniae]|uniref:proteasome endopeptidase complex n=1 Tax=Mitosporidium daphniae TaxID=1485682 RepID=A0A098VZ67_9MICR|nr:proteasome subunit beta type [Mitosporidium daphniae]KGG53036.1 proteasome subunit beta type [Mitosporidium daphniae]|eukprot:XP_013239472.1 proteasome subunit beta type [Mitosporidium daphniae]
MAVKFDGGVILGADSRTTTGAYIANRITDKITPLVDSSIYGCLSGSAADTQALADIVNIERNEPMSVHAAANIFKSLCYENKASLQAGIIVAGWDSVSNGAVYNIPLGGSIHRQPYAIGGSGSTYIYGYCDAAYRAGMTREQCEQFVTHGKATLLIIAIALAMERDGSSGGVIRLAIVTKDGCDRKVVAGADIPQHWRD